VKIDSVSALVSALAGTPLDDRPVIDLPILDTGECAYAIEIAGTEVESAWRVARSLVGETGRWPLVVTRRHHRLLVARLLRYASLGSLQPSQG
jgi:hypothetical protein